LVALNVAKSGLLKARRKSFKGDLLLGDVNALPFKEGLFDKVVCMEVIEHLKFPTMAIGEISRVLKNEGSLILTTPNGQRLIRFILRMAGVDLKMAPTHVHEFTLGELLEMITRKGLKLIKVG